MSNDTFLDTMSYVSKIKTKTLGKTEFKSKTLSKAQI